MLKFLSLDFTVLRLKIIRLKFVIMSLIKRGVWYELRFGPLFIYQVLGFPLSNNSSQLNHSFIEKAVCLKIFIIALHLFLIRLKNGFNGFQSLSYFSHLIIIISLLIFL